MNGVTHDQARADHQAILLASVQSYTEQG